MIKKAVICIAVISIALPVSGISFAVQTEAGIGFFTGEFAGHLDQSGAWPWTPVLDARIVLYPCGKAGIGVQTGSMAVIHPRSEPIEGIIRYQGITLEYPAMETPFPVILTGGAGFQDPGMLVSPYGSGFWEAGIIACCPLKPSFSLTFHLFYRSSFFQAVQIDEQYSDWDSNDTLQSLSGAVGLRYSM